MSHFTVGIISRVKPDDSYIEKVLAPYNENMEVKHTISKSEIIDKVRKEIQDFNNGVYQKYLKNPESYIEKCTNKSHIEYISKEFPKKLMWTDDECYKDGIRWYEEENILPNGDVVSYYNPKSKWDWYEIGGRWNNCIKTRFGETNSASIKDITNRYDNESAKNAKRFWELMVEGVEPKNEKDRELLKYPFYNKEYFLKYYQTKENYIKCKATFSTHAFIDEYGEWHEKGEMGWWGVSKQSENAEDNWIEEFSKRLDESASKNHWLTIVDCHI